MDTETVRQYKRIQVIEFQLTTFTMYFSIVALDRLAVFGQQATMYKNSYYTKNLSSLSF
jgi:hypothetical protein